MPMTSDAKRALSATIRSLRTRLLEDLHAATETAYRLSVRTSDAGLDEAARIKRGRLEAWVAEQLRAQNEGKSKAENKRSDKDFRKEAEKRAAYTLLNRLALLRLMEAPGPSGEPLRAPAVVTGGWESRAYQDFRQLAPGLVQNDETEGYAFLLKLVFEDLAAELPGLFGAIGVADLVPVPAATLRCVVDALNAPELDSCWTDDMTLGWVYQYWNDPEREALDAKLNSGGKVAPHEIASKTQMFTERYMVDWLLQNSLGPMWLAVCKKQGWTPEVESQGILDALESRREEWRKKRETGDVALTELMPLHTDAERRWAYYVPQPIPGDAVEKAPDSVREIKILDPAVGSGHFLVVAFGLLQALYKEEARHRGEAGEENWGDRAVVERILSNNLHGIELDQRAVQIAAAALWLKAKQAAPDARPKRLNLVASNLRLASLPDDDPALVELRLEVERETGIPGELTDTLVHALRGADHLGSLLKVDKAVDEALSRHEAELGKALPEQGELFSGFKEKRERKSIDREEAKATLLDRIERFLSKHTGGDDLGLRLRGEQLAAGVRFVRLVREGAYDLVVANPPYQGTSKMAESKYVEKTYPLGKADLYAAFLLRGLELVREGGFAAQVSMNGWMFIKQYAALRRDILENHSVRSVVDLLWCAFEQMRHNTVAMYCVMRGSTEGVSSVGLVPTPRNEREESIPALQRKRAATLCHEGRHTFDPAALKVVPEWPLVFWWRKERLDLYREGKLVGSSFPGKMGANLGNNSRYLRKPWEVRKNNTSGWQPYIKGGANRVWMEPLNEMVHWSSNGLEVKNLVQSKFGDAGLGWKIANSKYYFHLGVAFSPIGSCFAARAHSQRSIFDFKGNSVFPDDIAYAVCLLNSSNARNILEDLNPSISFQVGDINRLPLFHIELTDKIFMAIEAAFTLHESHREPSVEFKHPGPSPWRHAQEWAQEAVDRPEGAPLPDYIEELDPEPPTDHLSFALGVALGRFGKDGEGILDPATADLSHAMPHGILFLDTTLEAEDKRDSLGHPAAEPIHAAWTKHCPAVNTKRSLRDWLAVDFFKDVHKSMYENRPIHWPLSSPSKTFVAWINIHRMTEQTMRVLLADHLMPTLARIEGELADLRSARDGADKKAARPAEKQYDKLLKAKDELQTFINNVETCADQGAPPTDNKCPPREQDARYAPDLDDGVMINAAGLWPLLDPQWKDPKKWWKELATAKGRKDYDWSHSAMGYWPTRVDKKCQDDPSLGVAHGCFWRYHPERAWAWELRLQDEIEPAFKIEEAPYCPGGRDMEDSGDALHRAAFLKDFSEKALAAIEKEALRRMGRGKNRKPLSDMRILESGLWTDHAAELWEMELRLSEKQGSEVCILAPDEPEGRAAFIASHPNHADDRKRFMANLAPSPELFAEQDDDTDDMDDNEEDS